jgi:NAD(P)-dependent dehydrogenase (short-subunit alcohol dehydrogenase family)
MRLDGKVTLITGVSQYMGPAFTKTFTDAGAIVVTQDRKRAGAEPHAEYATRNSGGGRIIEADLTRPKDVETMFGTIDEQFGRIDILVSNYGIVGSIPFDELDDERVNDMFEQNFFSFCRVTRSAVTRMKGQGGGKIVALSGLAGITGTATLLTPIVDAVPPAYLSIYAASRGAQNAWVKAIGLELAPFNINVNAMAQENVDNNLMRSGAGGTDEHWNKLISRMPGKKMVSAEESAGLGLYLCSDLNGYVLRPGHTTVRRYLSIAESSDDPSAGPGRRAAAAPTQTHSPSAATLRPPSPTRQEDARAMTTSNPTPPTERATVQRTTPGLQSLTAALEVVTEKLGVKSVLIVRSDQGSMVVAATAGAAAVHYGLGSVGQKAGDATDRVPLYCERVVDSGETLFVRDSRADDLFAGNEDETEFGLSNYLGLPVCNPDGNVVGTVCVLDDHSRERRSPPRTRHAQRFSGSNTAQRRHRPRN